MAPMVCQLHCSFIVSSQLGTVFLQHTVQILDLLLLEVCILLLQLSIVLLQDTKQILCVTGMVAMISLCASAPQLLSQPVLCSSNSCRMLFIQSPATSLKGVAQVQPKVYVLQRLQAVCSYVDGLLGHVGKVFVQVDKRRNIPQFSCCWQAGERAASNQ